MQQGGWGGAPGQPGTPPQQGYAPQPGAPQQQQQGAPPPQGAPPGFQPPAAPSPEDAKSFFAGLFDFSFTNLITPKVIKFLYGLFLILWALGILGGLGMVVITLFQGEIIAAFVALILLPIIAVLYLVMIRMYHELIIIAFKMAQNLEQIKNNTAK
jgi:hypothetical protein